MVTPIVKTAVVIGGRLLVLRRSCAGACRGSKALLGCLLMGRGSSEPPSRLPRGCRYSRARRGLPEREHGLGNLAGGRIGDRSGGLVEDEQPRSGDLARDRLAVSD